MSDQGVPLAGVGWSSSLSVSEHTALREAGFEPRGLVMGSSVYQLGIDYSPRDYLMAANQGGVLGGPGGGWGGGPWGGGARAGGPWGGGGGGGAWGGWSGSVSFPGWCHYYSYDELGWGGGIGWAGAASTLGGFGAGTMAGALCWERTVFESGLEHAASLAIERIEAETASLGAHGVVGTRLEFRYLEGLPSTVEFTAIGTAVVRAGAGSLSRPFTSHLSGQDFFKLIQAGLVPVAVAVGAGSIVAELSAGRAGVSMELGPFGDAIETSRRFAAERLSAAARTDGTAVLGTLASSGMEGEASGRVMTTVLTGTVVRRFVRGSWSSLPLPIMRLSRP